MSTSGRAHYAATLGAEIQLKSKEKAQRLWRLGAQAGGSCAVHEIGHQMASLPKSLKGDEVSIFLTGSGAF